MKKILLISSRPISNIETLALIKDVLNRYEVKHCFLQKEVPEFSDDIEAMVFNHDTDSSEITRTLKTLSIQKKIPIIRIYSSFWGYDHIPEILVRQTLPEAASCLDNFFEN